jgi:hypothetical protein
VVEAIREPNGYAVRGVEFTKADPKRISGGWGISQQTEHRTSLDALEPLDDGLTRGEFWITPFFEEGGEDGARWTLEVRQDSSYRAVTRWNAQDTELANVARLLLGLARLEVPRFLHSTRTTQ